MTDSEIIKNLSLRLGQSQAETKRLLESSTKMIRDILDNDINITIPYLGTFYSHFIKSRKSFDPFHKHFIQLPPKRTIRFHPSSSMKNELKNIRF